MQRTQISLTADERQLLEAEAVQTGRSMSALIRDAVRLAYGSGRDADADLRAIDAALGAWRDREVEGEAYVDRIRSGGRLGEAAAR